MQYVQRIPRSEFTYIINKSKDRMMVVEVKGYRSHHRLVPLAVAILGLAWLQKLKSYIGVVSNKGYKILKNRLCSSTSLFLCRYLYGAYSGQIVFCTTKRQLIYVLVLVHLLLYCKLQCRYQVASSTRTRKYVVTPLHLHLTPSSFSCQSYTRTQSQILIKRSDSVSMRGGCVKSGGGGGTWTKRGAESFGD